MNVKYIVVLQQQQIPDAFLTLLFVQLQKVMCVTLCVQTPVAGDRDLTSVSPVGTTVVMAHVWAAVIFILGQ